MAQKKKIKKIIVAGPRDYKNYRFIHECLEKELPDDFSTIEIVEGGASGVDAVARRFAEVNGIRLKEFSADWDTYGKSAGPIRNGQMAQYADMLIAFDSGSKGTQNMIRQARNAGLEIKIIKII